MKYYILGNGSNILASSKDYNGIVLCLKKMKEIIIVKEYEDCIKATISSGVLCNKMCLELEKNNATGMEALFMLPSTIGGLIKNNSSCFDYTNERHVLRALIMNKEELRWYNNKELRFTYRKSAIEKDMIVLYVEFIFDKCKDKDLIFERKEKYKTYRLLNQPINKINAGSTFKNENGVKAWELIRDCNLKGYRINGAKISDKHLNFIINENNATSEDIYNLMNHIKKTIYEKKNINLDCEWNIINF